MAEVEEDGENVERLDRLYQTLASRWSGIKQTKIRSRAMPSILRRTLSPDLILSLCSVAELQLYADLGGNTILLSKDEVGMKILIWLAIMSPTLIPLVTNTTDGVISYNPQRVMRQLGYDQLTVMVTGEMGYSNLLIGYAQFIGRQRIDCIKF